MRRKKAIANDYYDPSLKEYRRRELEKAVPAGINYQFVKGSIADRELIERLFREYKFDTVVNLAAQAGVRYSIENRRTKQEQRPSSLGLCLARRRKSVA